MKDQLYAGYNTSDTEDEEQSSVDPDNDSDDEAGGGNKDALKLEDAMKDKWFPIR